MLRALGGPWRPAANGLCCCGRRTHRRTALTLFRAPERGERGIPRHDIVTAATSNPVQVDVYDHLRFITNRVFVRAHIVGWTAPSPPVSIAADTVPGVELRCTTVIGRVGEGVATGNARAAYLSALAMRERLAQVLAALDGVPVHHAFLERAPVGHAGRVQHAVDQCEVPTPGPAAQCAVPRRARQTPHTYASWHDVIGCARRRPEPPARFAVLTYVRRSGYGRGDDDPPGWAAGK